jgi:SAM-dependent methyltransferase
MMLQVLDPCCGGKMFFFDKNNQSTLFGDLRKESHILCDERLFSVAPGGIFDFRALPFKDKKFNLVVFDPPHLKSAGTSSWLAKKYGALNSKTWKRDLNLGINECWRVLREGGTMIFKWNETQIKISEILKLCPIKPLFGQTTTQNLKTHWIVFYKPAGQVEELTSPFS